MLRIHTIQTGTVGIKSKQLRGEGHGAMRLVHTLTDDTWEQPVPIYAWVIEHPEGIIVVPMKTGCILVASGAIRSIEHDVFQNRLPGRDSQCNGYIGRF